MGEIEVPSHFLCPISMQLMRDPVTVLTGITYDRDNIEKWLFSCKNNTCPVTKQHLSFTDLTPNHTLRRLIQSWCILNASNGVERVPTPKTPVDKSQILKLLNDAKQSPETLLKCLQRLKSIAQTSERNKACLEESGSVEFLASIVKKDDVKSREESDEALNILYHLQASDAGLRQLINDDKFFESLTIALSNGNAQSRTYGIMLLKSMFNMADPAKLISVKHYFLEQVVHILRDKISQQSSKAALKLLVEICPWGRNRIKVVESNAVSVLIEILVEESERRACELILVVLDQLCGCAEGRAELLKHGAGLAVVSKKILRVSHVATDRAVRILSSIIRFSATSRVLQEMLQVGVVTKLCLVLQVGGSGKTKERAREILKLHSRVWRDSPCIPLHLISFFPSS